MADVAPGLYQVEVDLSTLATAVHVSPVEEGLYDDEMLRLLGSGLDDDTCLFPALMAPQPMYHLYIVTPPGKAAEYVMRLPYFVSDSCLVSLADCTLTSAPIWYTFSNQQSVLYITFTTSVPPVLITQGLRDFADWVDMCTSWGMTYNHLFPSTFHPNIASIVCTTQPMLLIDHDHESPVWLPSQGEVFRHALQATAPSPLSPTPDWVRHMSTHLDGYSMHARFPRVERYHVEPRRPTPVSTPSSVHSPPPSPVMVTLQAGDWVVYLTPASDAFVCAQVKSVTPSVTLDTEANPPFVAKFDSQHHFLLSELQPFTSFQLLA